MSSTEVISTQYMPAVDYVWKASEAQTRTRVAAMAMQRINVDAPSLENFRKDYEEAVADIESSLTKFESSVNHPELRTMLTELRKKLKVYIDEQSEMKQFWTTKANYLQQGVPEKNPKQFFDFHVEFGDAQRKIRATYQDAEKSFSEVVAKTRKVADEMATEAASAGSTGRLVMIFAILLGVACSIGIGLYIASTTLKMLGADPSEISDVVKQVTLGDTSVNLRQDVNSGVYGDIKQMVAGLNEKANAAEAISKGDLTIEVRMASEKDRLGRAFQTMISVLRDIISRANSAATQVATGSAQVSGASQSLSQGATEQASSVEEISSSVSEISSKIKNNASNASTASDVAAQAQSAAQQGNRQIEVTLQAMNDINVSSQEISKIIKVIDDIAFQTNLLALNAAVEAARAGRHGKGFAVVADEVRNLAGRSAKAAKETTELIESSSRKVESGLGEAKKTSESFADIVRNSVRVSELIGQIAGASNEQATGISQIASGVNQINKVTQQTTANSEETAAAAEELASQANELRNSLAYFKLGHNQQMVQPSVQSVAKVRNLRPQQAPQSREDWGRSPSDEAERHALDDQDFGKYGT